MRHDQTIGEQILSGIFIFVWVLSRPFVWAYKMTKWFIVSVFEETGRRLVNLAVTVIVVVIVALISTHFRS